MDEKTEEECVNAFKTENKAVAEQLITRTTIDTAPATVRTTFQSFQFRDRTVGRVSLLHLAAYCGWKNIAIKLVNIHDSSADWKDDEGHIPLHYAAYNGHLEIAQYFVTTHQCDPMTESKYGDTPLHLACRKGHINIVNYFVDEVHCNPNYGNTNGETPLYASCWHGHHSITKYLISEAHCNPSQQNSDGSTPLHAACFNGHLNITQFLISEAHCNPSCEDNYGSTPLHSACYNYKHLNIVQYLISEAHCNPSCENKNGDTPLHIACRYGHLNIIRYLTSEAHCNPLHGNNEEYTPLHFASQHGYLNIVQYFIGDIHCDTSTKNNDGDTPLHVACWQGHLSIVQYLISEAHCDPSCKNNDGDTPLHVACYSDQLDVAQYLISESICSLFCENVFGETPLHSACYNGHLSIVQYLVNKAQCNPSCGNVDGDTPLHIACRHGHLDVAQYLINVAQCDPSCVDKDGNTLLHYANYPHIVQYLLSTGRVNPLAENKHGYTPLSTGKYEIISLFKPFIDCKTAFPVHTYTKLILIGDSGVGKTTMAKLFVLLAGKDKSAVALDCVTDVDRFTAGIVPHHIESELGNFVVYDFAGQQEYFSSHSAILEQVMRKSAAIFLCLIDISRDKDEICQSLQYWLSFIENACSTAKGASHVMIVGSHADLVKSSEETEEKSSLLQAIATRRVKRQEYVGHLVMDCRRANTDASHQLIVTLANSQKAIIATQPVTSYYCHVLFAFLHRKLNEIGCTLDSLISAITRENNSSLPSDPSILTEFLTTLSDRGLILFINHPNSSWVVVKTEVLLNEINGTLFAPPDLEENPNLASNTGIVPISNLHVVFPEYDLEMLIGFLESLEFCCQVDRSVLQYIRTTFTHSATDLFFFPGLVQSERPDFLIKEGTLYFGWCLGCVDSHEFFSSRFLHVLLLSVAYKFPLASRFIRSSSLSGLQRMCTVWRNGISWSDDDDITVVVELLDNNRWVMVAMSCDKDSPVKHAKLRSSLISLVRHLQQERCSNLNVYECLISPEFVCQYPFNDLSDKDLFDIYHVAQSILLKKKLVLSYKDGCGRLSTQSLPFEPYQLLTPSSVCQLFNPSLSNQPVPASLLQEVQELCCHSKAMPLVYKELRHYLDSMSIFAGRNPLVSK